MSLYWAPLLGAVVFELFHCYQLGRWLEDAARSDSTKVQQELSAALNTAITGRKVKVTAYTMVELGGRAGVVIVTNVT